MLYEELEDYVRSLRNTKNIGFEMLTDAFDIEDVCCESTGEPSNYDNKRKAPNVKSTITAHRSLGIEGVVVVCLQIRTILLSSQCLG